MDYQLDVCFNNMSMAQHIRHGTQGSQPGTVYSAETMFVWEFIQAMFILLDILIWRSYQQTTNISGKISNVQYWMVSNITNNYQGGEEFFKFQELGDRTLDIKSTYCYRWNGYIQRILYQVRFKSYMFMQVLQEIHMFFMILKVLHVCLLVVMFIFEQIKGLIY